MFLSEVNDQGLAEAAHFYSDFALSQVAATEDFLSFDMLSHPLTSCVGRVL
jgi:hypothetical protein